MLNFIKNLFSKDSVPSILPKYERPPHEPQPEDYWIEYEIGSHAVIAVPKEYRDDIMWSNKAKNWYEKAVKGKVAWFDMTIPDGTVVTIAKPSNCGWYTATTTTGVVVQVPHEFLQDAPDSKFHMYYCPVGGK